MGSDLLNGVRLEQDVFAGELLVGVVNHIAAFFDAIAVGEPIGSRPAGALPNLLHGPDVEGALSFEMWLSRIDNAVGILGRIECAAFVGHIAQHVI